MWFPLDTMQATLINAVWEIDFAPSNRDRELASITLTGPANSSVKVFLDTILLDVTARGDFNRADYYKGIPIAAGRQLKLIWNTGSGSAPTATAAYTDGDSGALAALTGNARLIGS